MNSRVQDVVFLIHGTFSHRDEDHFEPDEKNPGETAAWWQKNSDFVAEMDRLLDGKACCWPEDICQAMPWAKRSFWHGVEEWTIRGWKPFRWIRPKYRILNRQLFVWSGLNSETERRRAGGRLLEGLLSLERDNEAKLKAGEAPRFYHLIGHSHGGSVIWNALRFASHQGESLPHLKSWSTLGTPFPTYAPIKYLAVRSLVGLVVLGVFGWLALRGGELRYSGLSLPTLEALFSPFSPVNLIPFGVSLPTVGILAILLVLAGGFLIAIFFWLVRWKENRDDSRDSDNAWRRFGGRWLGLFSTIDEAIAGSQNTVGFYVTDLFRLPSPALPPVPRSWRAMEFVSLLLRYPIWLGSCLTVPLANLVVLPLAEYVSSTILRLKFQGSDRPGACLTLISPVPYSRKSSLDEAALGPLPPSLEEHLRDLAGSEISSKVLKGRIGFATDARSLNSPHELLRAYFSLNVSNELIHNSYYNLDAIRRVLAYRILGPDRTSRSDVDLGLDPDTRSWVEGLNTASPPRTYLPEPKPPNNTPFSTQALLAAMVLLLCGMGYAGLKADIDTVYIERLLNEITDPKKITETKEWKRPDLLRQALVAFQRRAEPRLIERIANRDDETRLRGLAYLQEFATPIDDVSINRRKASPIQLAPKSIDSLIQLAFEGSTNQKVRIETLRLLFGLPDRKEVGNRLADRFLHGTLTVARNSNKEAKISRFAPIVSASLFHLGAGGGEGLIRLYLVSKDYYEGGRERSRLAGVVRRLEPDVLSEAVKPLIDRLNDADAKVRISMADALGTIGTAVAPHAIKPLVELFDDPDPSVRYAAVQALASIGGPSAASEKVKPLIDRLIDRDEKVRGMAALALELLGPAAAPDAVKPLVERLGDSDASVRDAAVMALGRIGPVAATEALKPLVGLMRRTDGFSQSNAVEALSLMGPTAAPELVKPLITMLGDISVLQRSRAAEALGSIGPVLAPEAVKPLVGLLSDTQATVRKSASNALGKFGSDFASQTVKPLVSLIDDTDADVRKSAAEALGRIGPASTEAIGPLIARLGDEKEEVRESAAKALGMIGPAAVLEATTTLLEKGSPQSAWTALGKIDPAGASVAVNALVARVTNNDAKSMSQAIEALGPAEQGDTKAAFEARLLRLRNDDERVQRHAVEALGEFGLVAAPTAIKPLRSRLNPTGVVLIDPYDRISTALALFKIDPASAPVAVQSVAVWLRNEDANLRNLAAQSLSKFGPAALEAVKPLVARIGDTYPFVRRSAAEALGSIGPAAAPEAVEPLIGLLNSEYSDVCVAAAQALGRIGSAAGPNAVMPLVERLVDANESIRSSAAEALASIDVTKASEELCKILYSSDDEDAKATAVLALEKIGPKAADAVPHLIARAISGDTKAREEALKALESINRGTGH